MTDNVFQNFVSNVYAGGSALEFFDDNFEVIGGADDITLDSIFGGCDCSGGDSNDDEMVEGGSSLDDTGDTLEDTKSISLDKENPDSDEDMFTTYTEKEADQTEIKKVYNDDDESIVTTYTLDGKKEPAKYGAGLSGGLSAEEVSGLLSIYN